MRRSPIDRRARLDGARQFVSEYDIDPGGERPSRMGAFNSMPPRIHRTHSDPTKPDIFPPAAQTPTQEELRVEKVEADSTSRQSAPPALNPLDIIRGLLQNLDENPDREGLKETPDRYLRALQFWTSGVGKNPADVLKTFEDGAEHYDELVFQGSIPVFSTCEHHLVPFFGQAHIAYIPNGKIVGLSKLARVLEIFARRLTVQERVSTQVADALMEHVQPLGVAVTLQCRHLCMESRGIQKTGTITTTTALRGCFKNEHETRAEFISLVNAASK